MRTFFVSASGAFRMQPGGVLEFMGTDTQTITTNSSDSYNSYRTLLINGTEVIQLSDMAGPNKINDDLRIYKGKYGVGKLTTEVNQTVYIRQSASMRLDRTSLRIFNLYTEPGSLFISTGTTGDSAYVLKSTTTNYGFQITGFIQSNFTRFAGMDEHGVYIYTGVINDGFNHCAFSSTEPYGTMLRIESAESISLYDVSFLFDPSLYQKSVTKITDYGDVTVDRFYPTTSPAYEEDSHDRILWR